jgi:hypothetical protein
VADALTENNGFCRATAGNGGKAVAEVPPPPPPADLRRPLERTIRLPTSEEAGLMDMAEEADDDDVEEEEEEEDPWVVPEPAGDTSRDDRWCTTRG